MPPDLSPRKTRLPTRSFFTDVLYAKPLQETFQAFHRLLSPDYNNANIRRGLDYRVQEYVDYLILRMWQVRQSFVEQPYTRPEDLPAYQKIWLFPEHEPDRQGNCEWTEELMQDAARHFNASYKRILGHSALILGDDLLKRVTGVIEQNREELL